MSLIKEEPFKSIIAREWLRAKKKLPLLRKRTKPKFYWLETFTTASGDKLSHRHADCNRGKNRIRFHYKYRSLKHHHEFVLTLRHEFAHLLQPTYGQASHGADFMWWCQRLGGTRWAKHFHDLV